MKKEKDVSRNVIVVLLILAVLVSVFNVFTMINTANNRMRPFSYQEILGQGQVKVIIEEPFVGEVPNKEVSVRILPAS